MKKFKLASLLVLTITTVVFSLSACYASDIPDHEHVFSEATCTTPRTCECGETEGEALGHTLVADSAIDPTCTETGVTIEVDSLESVVLNNTASTIARIATVKVLYVG